MRYCTGSSPIGLLGKGLILKANPSQFRRGKRVNFPPTRVDPWPSFIFGALCWSFELETETWRLARSSARDSFHGLSRAQALDAIASIGNS